MAEEMHEQGMTLRRYHMCRRNSKEQQNKTRKGGLKTYAEMTIYARHS